MGKKRTIIIIGGGYLQVPLVDTAKAMGLHIVVFDMSPQAPGMLKADESVVMSTRDIDGCVREAKRLSWKRSIHGVLTAGTDASRAVAAIANALELPGIRFADAEAASNKVLMRKRLKAHNVPIPRFFPVWSLKDARQAMDELTFPLVMKPADNMGARGVIKVRNREEMYSAFRHAKKNCPTGEMILEEFMEGPELSVDALAWNGQIRITGVADRIITREPYFIEIGHNMPSSLPGAVLEEAASVMKSGMQALGITTGAGKGDLKVTAQGVMVGEIAARLSGGFMSSHTYPLHSGVNLYRAAIQIALGDEPDNLEPAFHRIAIERGILCEPGRILEITGTEQAAHIPGVHSIHLTRAAGDLMPEITSNIDKIGHVIVSANTLGEAEKIAASALAAISVDVDTSAGVDWLQVEERAREKLGERVCHVCKSCDGANCASSVPGMGGVGSMNTFRDNGLALGEYMIRPRYIREQITPDTSIELFGRKFEYPVFIAPITGAATNLGGNLREEDLATALLLGARNSGSLAFVGDGASPEKWTVIRSALERMGGFGIPVFKPRADAKELERRFVEAQNAGAVAVAMDIDALGIRTMALRRQATTARTESALRELKNTVKIPFILKGIISPVDAKLAIEAGADAIIVSNHGGRVLDDMPGTARVLPEIAEIIGKRIPVLVDGGIRSGRDAFKMLALGADAVLVGRPFVIAAAGGDQPAVQYLLRRFWNELRETMMQCGNPCLDEINGTFLLRKTTVQEIRKGEHQPSK